MYLLRYGAFLMIFLVFSGLSACVAGGGIIHAINPPFPEGKKFLVSQGFLGEKTHRDAVNRYAVDLVMSQGEPVCAVQAGVVKRLHTSGAYVLEGGQSNFVRIAHKNGTIGDYQHLLPGSITVTAGQQVQRGQCFARVGNTGQSTGPHLHFALLGRVNGSLVSLPFQFIDPQGKRYTPEYLGWVRH